MDSLVQLQLHHRHVSMTALRCGARGILPRAPRARAHACAHHASHTGHQPPAHTLMMPRISLPRTRTRTACHSNRTSKLGHCLQQGGPTLIHCALLYTHTHTLSRSHSLCPLRRRSPTDIVMLAYRRASTGPGDTAPPIIIYHYYYRIPYQYHYTQPHLHASMIPRISSPYTVARTRDSSCGSTPATTACVCEGFLAAYEWWNPLQ